MHLQTASPAGWPQAGLSLWGAVPLWARGLQKALLQQQPEDDGKRSPRPQDLIRLYDIILQVTLEGWESRVRLVCVLDTEWLSVA